MKQNHYIQLLSRLLTKVLTAVNTRYNCNNARMMIQTMIPGQELVQEPGTGTGTQALAQELVQAQETEKILVQELAQAQVQVQAQEQVLGYRNWTQELDHQQVVKHFKFYELWVKMISPKISISRLILI